MIWYNFVILLKTAGSGQMRFCGGNHKHPRPRLETLRSLWLALLLLGVVQLSGCASVSSAQVWDQLVFRAANNGFRAEIFEAHPFTLSGLIKGTPGTSSELVVYLEGDGRGVVRGRVTHDPTPRQAMGYELARSDRAPSVLYLARVGQFQPSQTGPDYQAYWSSKRLAEESVVAASLAIDQVMARLGASHLHLVGYSGGGGLALLLAERRQDVLTVTTVAGLLDIDWWVKEKNFQPLTGSLNPAEGASILAPLPQVHFFGAHDSIIPPTMSAHFQTLAPFTDFQRVEVDTNHWNDWPELWPDLFERHLVSLRAKSVPRNEDRVI